jgi:hypothetical protein
MPNRLSFQEEMLMLFAYIGPETMMPIASGLAAVVGVFLMFGRSVTLFFRTLARKVGALGGGKPPKSGFMEELPPPLAPGAAEQEKPAVG